VFNKPILKLSGYETLMGLKKHISKKSGTSLPLSERLSLSRAIARLQPTFDPVRAKSRA